MESGRLRDKLSIDAPDHGQDDIGARVERWTPFADVWGEVVTLSGQKLAFARSFAATVTHKITIRFLDGVTEQHRIRLPEGRTLLINSVIDPDRRRRQLDILCSEVI